MASYDYVSQRVIDDTTLIAMTPNQWSDALHFNEYPLVSVINKVKASGDGTWHYWMNGQTANVKTLLNGAMTGGAASEAITVDSTANFAVNNAVIIARNGALDAQVCKVTVVTDATTMTVATIDGSNLSAHADDTRVILSGDYVKYGSLVNQPLRLATRDYNYIEQLSASAEIAANVAKGKFNDNKTSVEAYLIRECMLNYKQKMEFALLFGDGVDPRNASTTDYSKMDGLLNLLPTTRITSTPAAFSKSDVRGAVSDAMKTGGFKSPVNYCIANAQFVDNWYALDDSTTGLSQKTTDSYFQEITVRGKTFKVIESQTMNEYYKDGESACFFVSSKIGNEAGFAIATLEDSDGSRIRMMPNEDEVVKSKMAVASFCTAQLVNPEAHCLYLASN